MTTGESNQAVTLEASAPTPKKGKPRILILSHLFWPVVGGLVGVPMLLARRMAQAGYPLSVVTSTPDAPNRESLGYPVIRQPSPAELWRAVQSADLIVVNHPSLQASWPLLFLRKPFVVIVHCWISLRGPSGLLRRSLFRRAAACIAVSQAIERHLPVRGKVLPNPYDEEIFFPDPSVLRTRDLLFVGRMVIGKGPFDLLEALGLLRVRGFFATATLVGYGPAKEEIERRSRELGLEGQIEVRGACEPLTVAALMRTHRIVVIPSIWEEPFGIVALEAIACGCGVIGSNGGGLLEAMGPCGLGYPNGNVRALAEKVEELLGNPDRIDRLLAGAPEQLAKHTSRAVASRYLELFHGILETR
ncbi:MAG: glycosyltransferase family 4 protein [Methylacidiphilaceae bacterium]|nr:glycosyltransferase family 4 protein [Candidatus Methylacidiphilaceae bacterium]